MEKRASEINPSGVILRLDLRMLSLSRGMERDMLVAGAEKILNANLVRLSKKVRLGF